MNLLFWNGIISAFAFFSWVAIDQHTDILKSFYNALKPGGEILIRTQAWQERPYRIATQKVMDRVKWASFFQDYKAPFVDQTEYGFNQCLKEAGFEEAETFLVEDTFYFPNKEAIVTYFLQWLPQQSRIAETCEEDTRALRKLFVEEVVDQYCDDLSCSCLIPLVFPGIIAQAKKTLPKQDYIKA